MAHGESSLNSSLLKMRPFDCKDHFRRKDDGYPEFPDGWPLYVNTTTTTRLWTLDEILFPLGATICPEVVPRCYAMGMFPPECVDDTPALVTNTYAIAPTNNCAGTPIAASTVKYAQCEKSGYKLAYAHKFWQGRRGFNVPSDALVTVHYLTQHWSGTYFLDATGSPGCPFTEDISAERDYTYSVSRTSGKITCSGSCEEVGSAYFLALFDTGVNNDRLTNPDPFLEAVLNGDTEIGVAHLGTGGHDLGACAGEQCDLLARRRRDRRRLLGLRLSAASAGELRC